MIKLGSLSFLEGARILITGGTGSLGRKLTHTLLNRTRNTTIILFSRDEYTEVKH